MVLELCSHIWDRFSHQFFVFITVECRAGVLQIVHHCIVAGIGLGETVSKAKCFLHVQKRRLVVLLTKRIASIVVVAHERVTFVRIKHRSVLYFGFM